MPDPLNALLVQLFKIPWIKARWAGRFEARQGADRPFSPLDKPLAECRLSLITTGGPHLKADPPFDMEDPNGDASFRTFPFQTPWEEVTITHKYYDHKGADKDLGVLLPIHPLKRAVAEGRVGSWGPRVYSLMGHLLDEQLSRLYEETLPALIKNLRQDRADCVLLTPA